LVHLVKKQLPLPTEHHFTGKERDTESGNDYFGARYRDPAALDWISRTN
jgi:hypothetical protein